MLIRVKRDLSLNKALDKTKLVLVDIQAQGKNGAYRTKRWKNPNKGLEITERQIQNAKKKEGFVVYTDKKSGIMKLGSEVTNEYLKTRSNSNISLNQHITRNYKVKVAEKESNLYNLINKIQSTKTNTEDSDGKDSLKKYTDKNGNLTKEREFLHQRIILNHFKERNPAEGEKVFIILGGGSASGKSTVLKKGLIKQPEGREKAVTIDSDNIKTMLPEYKKMTKENNPDAAGYAHEESSAIAKRIQTIALELGYNVILDGTGDGSENSLRKKIKQGKDNGYRVRGEYVTVPTEVALKRAKERAAKTKRHIKESTIINIHGKVSLRAVQFAKEFDEINVYDNTSDSILIATGGNGKELEAVKGHEKDLENFINKGVGYE